MTRKGPTLSFPPASENPSTVSMEVMITGAFILLGAAIVAQSVSTLRAVTMPDEGPDSDLRQAIPFLAPLFLYLQVVGRVTSAESRIA